jgi:hypothetical protein
MKRLGIAITLLGLASRAAVAQQTAKDSITRCDSSIAAKRVDSVALGLFFTATRVDGYELGTLQSQIVATAVATSFVAPMPFQVRVFEGPAQMRTIRRLHKDTSTAVRAPSVTGVYRFTSTRTQAVAHAETVRASLVTGLDSAMIAAIHDASMIKEVIDMPPDQDSMRVQIRVSTDSGFGSRRIATISFPRMAVVDAVPLRDNPGAIVPVGVQPDSAEGILLRFVVGQSGSPDLGTVELARGRSMPLLRAALEALSAQLFAPATIGGCAVSQVVYYPFSFGVAAQKTPPRH